MQETHGQLLKKLIRRKRLTQAQAADSLGYSLPKLTRLLTRERIDEVTREEIENFFQIGPGYFPTPPETNAVAEPAAPYSTTNNGPNCWQLLAEARQEIIDLQKQLLELSRPSMNAPGRKKGQPV